MDLNLIRRVIREELKYAVVGQIISNESATRSTIQRYSNEPPRKNNRVILPFGLSSKAPANTQAMILPGGSDPTNQNVVGNFDEARPNIGDGESCLYNAFGQAIRITNGKILIGSATSSESVVLGNQLKMLLTNLIELIATHTHPGPGAPPSNAADFEQLKSNIDVVLSKLVLTE